MDLTYEVYTYEIPEAIFAREVVAAGLSYCRRLQWDTSSRKLCDEPGWERLQVYVADDHTYATYRIGDCLAYIGIRHGELFGYVAGPEEAVQRVCEEVARVYPRVELDAQEVEYSFWHCVPGQRHYSRKRAIAVPRWEEITLNYAASTRSELGRMMTSGRPATGGRLSVWLGEPGTGKTFALRALSWAWREWCRFEYVLDPERFFGDSDYMLDVLLREPGDQEEAWRMLVLEDTGELVVADAKKEAGQGLSRMLNVADGLIGQGLRVQFLITTNEDAGLLHPAVLRPGRCAFQIEFKALEFAAARAWAAAHDFELTERRSYRLAELFAIRDGADLQPQRPRLGFVS